MFMRESKSARIIVKPEFYEAWEAMLARTGLSQQDVFDRCVRFLLSQDATMQAMILGTLPPAEDLISLVLKRLQQPANRGVIERKSRQNMGGGGGRR